MTAGSPAAEDPPSLEELVEQCVLASSRGEAGLLEELCARYPQHATQLRQRIDQLRSMGLLETEAPDADAPRVPGYSVLRELGYGGMGIVYHARQTEPVTRDVALKVMTDAVGARELLSRFHLERRTLARLQHPHIAQLYDAGQTESGAPFFAMEYVEGHDLRTFSDRERLSVEQRVGLLADLCDAVQYAHRRGVIHRDLKPTNILVYRAEGGRIVPKVIDFGIAKILDSEERPMETLLTMQNEIVGTPEYLSPEQAGVVDGDVDTRTDVYSLGVVAYELLTGHLPFRVDRSARAWLIELQRALRDSDPTPPSVRATTSRDVETATLRDTTPLGLRRALRGDLDWVILRALARDPARRYQSAADFADELRRYLRSEPVLAGAPSQLHRLRKWVGRHKVLSATIATLLIGFLTNSLLMIQAFAAERRSQKETEKALAVQQFLQEMLSSADPLGRYGADITVRKVLDAAAEKIEGQFADRPEVEASLRLTIGRTYYNLYELWEPAEKHVRRAYELLQQIHGGSDHEETWQAMQLLCEIVGYSRSEDAVSLARAAIAMARRIYGEDSYQEALSCHDLAFNLYRMSHRGEHPEAMRAEAEAVYDRVIALYRRHKGPDSEMVPRAIHAKALIPLYFGRPAEAWPMLQQAVQLFDRALPRTHAWFWSIWDDYGYAALLTGNLQQHVEGCRNYIDLAKEIWGPSALQVVQAARLCGQLAAAGKAHAAALGYYDEALATLAAMEEPDEDWRAYVFLNRASSLVALERKAEARADLDRCDAALQAFGKPEPSLEKALNEARASLEAR